MATYAESVFAAEIRALPSGYTGLPRELVEASQRQRLIHGVTIAVAEKGFAAATIADITNRAGVSKKTFYEHFSDKLGCFLAAYDHGSAAILRAVATASLQARQEGRDAVEQLRAGTAAYAGFLAAEERYARTFCLEMLAAGPEAIARHRSCRDAFAQTLRAWHEHARSDHVDWPAASAFAYEAATGVVYEISCARIATGRVTRLPRSVADLVNAQLAILGVAERCAPAA